MSESRNNRPAQLSALIEALEHLIPLAAANQCEVWLPALDYCLRFAKHLREVGFVQADLDELSGNVKEVFAGGMGGFSDCVATYQPELFEEWSDATYRFGLDLHLVESSNGPR